MTGDERNWKSPEEQVQAPLRLLVICDEWHSTSGGIASFNRNLCLALAASDRADVMCQVKSATDEERREARDQGVELVLAPKAVMEPKLSLPSEEAKTFMPHYVIGHGREPSGGEDACVMARHQFEIPFVWFVHDLPSETSPHKGKESVGRDVHDKVTMARRVATLADVVVAVGPRLAAKSDVELRYALGPRRVHRVDPGFLPAGRGGAGPELDHHILLMLCRVDDVGPKGVDIAAAALGVLRTTSPKRYQDVRLWLRGTEHPERSNDLEDRLTSNYGLSVGDITILPFTSDRESILGDLYSASILLMPSRAEGFGLAAWEAMEIGIPVLVSDRSGLANLLVEVLGDSALRVIVPVRGVVDEDAAEWADRIAGILEDTDAAFAHAKSMQDELASAFTWERTAERVLSAIRGSDKYRG